MTRARDNATQSGLVLINKGTFSSVAFFQVTNCFSASYKDYKIKLKFTRTNDNQTQMRYITPDGTLVESNYSNNVTAAQGTTTLTGVSYDDNQGYIRLYTTNAGYRNNNFATIEISNPFVAANTVGTLFAAGQNINNTTPGWWIGQNSHNTATSFSGFRITAETGTFTGEYQIYGYRD